MQQVGTRRIARSIALAFGYFVLASLTVATTRFGDGVAFIWIANAWLLAELSILSRKEWFRPLVACCIASVFATALFGFGTVYALPLAAINMVETFVGAYILRRIKPSATRFDSLAAMFVFILAAGIVAPAITAFGGAAIAELSGKPFWESWIRWFAGHSLGALSFTALFTLFLRGDIEQWMRQATLSRCLEAGVVLGVVVFTAILVFAQDRFPLLFLPLLPLIIAIFRLGRFGAALSVMVLTLVGFAFTLNDTGPIALMRGDLGSRLQFLQFYLAVTVLVALPVAADLKHRKRVHAALRDSEARYRLLMARSSDIVMNLDVEGRLRFISPSIRTLGGYEPRDLVGTYALDLVHPDDRDRVRLIHLDALRIPETPFVVEYRACHSDGGQLWMETHVQGILDEDGSVSGVVNVVRDVSHRKAREERLVVEADTDPLTGLLNRRGFVRCIKDEAVDLEGYCLAMFDIDRFKLVNDRYGHAAGDEVLKTFARVACHTIRDGDRIGRLGGEEFAILLKTATHDEAIIVCERLRKTVAAASTAFGQHEITVTVSGGIAAFGSRADLDEVLTLADTALYRAKRSGRNQLALAA